MSAGKIFDYSKWDKIELSDDESDLHPNIDKDSWFRLKHRTRIEREEKEDQEIKFYNKENTENQSRLSIINARLNGLKNGNVEDAEFEDIEALKCEADELEKLVAERNNRINEINERRKWNIDNICHVTEEKTIVNSSTTISLKAEDFQPTGLTEKAFPEVHTTSDNSKQKLAVVVPPKVPQESVSTTSSQNNVTKSKDMSSLPGPVESTMGSASVTGTIPRERLAVISYNDYVLTHEKTLEEYSEIKDLEDTKEYLFKNCDVLLHEHAQSYMLLSCLEDEMNGKRERMKHVCRQSQILSHVTDLAVSMKRDPRDVVRPFFVRISEPEYLSAFTQAAKEFTEKIVKRAVEKRKEMDAEKDDDEEDVPLGPGGLNPYKVLQSLPIAMKKAFEEQNIPKLHEVIGKMTPDDAKHYMKLCVDSGLWVAKDSSIFEDDENEDENEEILEGEEEEGGTPVIEGESNEEVKE